MNKNKIKKLKEKCLSIIDKIVDFIMKYRYIIAFSTLCILVLFNVNFSSIGMWSRYLNEPETKNDYIGVARGIRSDEWLTQSSYMIGQALRKDGYTVHNPNIAQGQANMLMISAPVNDILEISRPMLWGFHIFSVSRGFSFYWALRMIALILLSIELIKKITNNNFLSLAGGIIIAFAPPMMWWFSTAIVDAYIYGMATLLLFGYYMQNLDFKLWKKILIALGIVITLPGFVYTLYPAFQVPFAFLMAVFMINSLVKNWRDLKKTDFILMGCTLILVLALIGRFILLSIDDIKAMMNTVYPGNREVTGGTFTTDNFIVYLLNIFFPYKCGIANTCEPSTYIYSFTGLLILIITYLKDIRKEKEDSNFSLIISLIILYFMFLFWEFIGFKKIFAKITFMYFSPEQRTHVVTGIVGTLLAIIMIQKFKNNKIFTKLQAIVISLIVVVLSCVLLRQSVYTGIIGHVKYAIISIIAFVLTYFFILGDIKKWSFCMIGITIIAGMTINPISIGIKPITETNISKTIEKINSEDFGVLWAGDSNITGQYLVANCINTLNGVNTYPNFKWLNIVDPDKKYDDIYNRFAHISIVLTTGDETYFQLVAPDNYIAYLTYQNIKDIGIKYYFSLSKLSDETINEFKLKEIFKDEERTQYIYEFE